MVNEKFVTFVLSICVMVLLPTSSAEMANQKHDFLWQISREAFDFAATCLDELKVGFGPVTDMMYYWQDDYVPKDNNTGCVLLCALTKLNLLNDKGDIETKKLDEFAALRNISEDGIMSILVIFDQCVEDNKNETDLCSLVMKRVKCFTDTYSQRGIVIDTYTPTNTSTNISTASKMTSKPASKATSKVTSTITSSPLPTSANTKAIVPKNVRVFI